MKSERVSDSGRAANIAIIGVSGRFPGAPDIATFWRNLCGGVESVTHFDPAEIEDVFGPAVRADGSYVAARSILENTEMFDAGFFGMHAREAELTDPQHRLLLECSWEALEDAGYDPAAYAGKIGLTAGCSIGTYFMRHVLQERAAIERFTSDYQVGSYPELLGAGADFLATRVAYKLNLRGPALTVQSACSTSLLAVAQACQTLMLGLADMMLAGAASITFPQKRGYLHQEGGMVASDGHCRTFDAQADGTVFGSGAGVIVLKRLEDALADGDAIYAVIRGFGINNDGSAKIGYTAPSAEGQAAAISDAHAMAGFDPKTIGYVECHGTATPLGDPIEIAALTKAFAGADAPASCALGSVKTNIGHLDVAAGMSGIIKTALAVRYGKIPPTLHYTTPNPHIDFDAGPFFVNTKLADWNDERRRAGVSAFGLGGTNVHVVLEAAPERARGAESNSAELVVLSARSEAALDAARTQLCAHLRSARGTEECFADIAATLQAGRRAFSHRLALVAGSAEEAAAKLAGASGSGCALGRAGNGEHNVVFMFPGQGAQYTGMGRELYEQASVFRAAIDRCAEFLKPALRCDLRGLLYPAGENAGSSLRATEHAQPAIFAVEYALAQLWMSWGIKPSSMIGHSVGEFVAACLAGVLSLEDALSLVAERGRLMQALPGGAMLAVRLPGAELAELLDAPLGIAALNAPALSVAAGPFDAIAALEANLTLRDVPYRRLETSHAFHSPMMDAVIAPLVERARAVRFSEPEIPYISGVTGTWITADDATSADYWARHCREPVHFAPGVATIVEDGATVLLEVGPGQALSTFALQGAAKNSGRTIVASLPGANAEAGDLQCMLESLGRLWVAGLQPDWTAFHGATARRRVSLPTYPFERARHFIDISHAEPATTELPHMNGSVTSHAAVEAAPPQVAAPATDRKPRLERELAALLEELSGESVGQDDVATSFLELGFDSLFLGRFAQQVQTRFGAAITFRQLLNEIPSVATLAAYILPMLPPEAAPAPAASSAPASAVTAAGTPLSAPASAIEAVMRDQLQAMQQLIREQLAALQGVSPGAAPASSLPSAPAPVASAAPAAVAPAPVVADDAPSRFDVYRVSARSAQSDFGPEQRAHIDELIARTVERTKTSKELTQRYRSVLADPRVANGFRAEWKEMVYPITCTRAHGSRLWDVDGNEYIDILNGFGQTFFGHAPDFVVDAVSEQLGRGFAIGPQTELAGEVAELFCEITGNERVTFCNTGSEAVMAAMRLARTVTGRNRVVVFNGAYHGQFDEVLVKGARSSHRSLPVAAGIPQESVSNMTVLDYGAPASLEWIREHAAELAAVIVEPVQSRHPGLQPKAFLQELRTITEGSGTALVFDEVVTGFRIHMAGMQNVFGIRADLATYGKVVGGGLPIGILAGKGRFMDALDGGMWQYGDDSTPEVPPTFFAGTFVRHPLVMAAVRAVLGYVKEHGTALQSGVSERTARLVGRLNEDFARRGFVSRIEHCGSLFYVNVANEDRLAGLLFYHLRLRGIYIQEGFPCFLTTTHTDADVDQIVEAFSESLDELKGAGILCGDPALLAAQLPREVQLTEEQTEIWLAAQLGDEASCAFNESVTLRLSGKLDEAAFAQAWNRVRDRHDVLRATFTPTGEMMHIAAGGSFAYDSSDLSSLSQEQAERAFQELLAQDARRPFDLVAGPLVRGTLVRLPGAAHAFVLTAHHIICDGWSVNVLLGEFAALYSALHRGETLELQKPLSFVDYARAQHGRDPEEHAKVEKFWLAQFAEPVTLLELPTDRPRAEMKSFAGATRSTSIGREQYSAIKKAGARQGCTLFATLLAGFATLMGRLGDRSDVVVGVPAAGQSLLEDQILVGHCVDFLPIRTRWNPSDRLADLLASVKRNVLDAYEHQTYTLGTLVRKLEQPREMGRLPLTEIQFNLERLADGLSLPDLEVTIEPNAKANVNFDLFLNVIESSDGLRIDCDYNTDLFDAATIDRWLKYYEVILSAIVADLETPVRSVAYLPAGERREVLLINETARTYPHDARVNSLFEAQAARCPGAVAAMHGSESLTYGALDRRANQLANYLRTRTGAEGKLVGVAVERSLDMLVALLAVHKAGCAYVPLDRIHPDARLRSMLEEANVAAVLTDDAQQSAFVPAGTPLIDLGRERDAIAAEPETPATLEPCAGAPAYVIFTSGSTGKPKGVEVTHRSVVNFLTSMAHEPGLVQNDVLVAVTTISFDIAALELFLPLVTGAAVAIASKEETADGFQLRALLEATAATTMQATPVTWRLLLEAGFRAPSGFKMLCGGEALARDLANRLLEGDGELWNMYGPTETTIWSSCLRVTAGDHPITVGRPIANTQFYVLDAYDQPVALGRPGQLHIGGDGVARGYLNQPELTAEKFVANPFAAGRMYRTGDSARLLPGGDVQVLGRIDHQVKLRGFRIELGEIEAILARKGELAASAVALREDTPGSPRLVAYFVERAATAKTPAELQALLAQELPDYMVPSMWVRLDALPVSANGKLDRAALPVPELPAASDADFAAPQSAIEIALAEIWRDVLKLERVSVTDDLFALGADSINLFQITARANREGLALMAKQLLQHRTIGELAASLEATAAEGLRPAFERPSLRRSLRERLQSSA